MNLKKYKKNIIGQYCRDYFYAIRKELQKFLINDTQVKTLHTLPKIKIGDEIVMLSHGKIVNTFIVLDIEKDNSEKSVVNAYLYSINNDYESKHNPQWWTVFNILNIRWNISKRLEKQHKNKEKVMNRQQKRQAQKRLKKGRFPFPDYDKWISHYLHTHPHFLVQIGPNIIRSNFEGAIKNYNVLEFRVLLDRLRKAEEKSEKKTTESIVD